MNAILSFSILLLFVFLYSSALFKNKQIKRIRFLTILSVISLSLFSSACASLFLPDYTLIDVYWGDDNATYGIGLKINGEQIWDGATGSFTASGEDSDGNVKWLHPLCAEPRQDAVLGSDVNESFYLSDISAINGGLEAAWLYEYADTYSDGYTEKEKTGALQLAIWEVITEEPGTAYSLDTGDFTVYESKGLDTLTELLLNGLEANFSDADKELLKAGYVIAANSEYQDFIIDEDVMPPTVPENLSAEAFFVQIDLSWDAASDNDSVSGYKILRDGIQVATTTGTVWTDTDVIASVSYTYTVRACDPSENCSGESDPAQATIPEASPLIEKSILSGSDIVAVGNTVTFEITVTLPESTTPVNVKITDTMPFAAGILEITSAEVISVGASIGGSSLGFGDSGVISDAHNQVEFDFGSLTNTPDGLSDAGDRIVVRVSALATSELPSDALVHYWKLDETTGLAATDTGSALEKADGVLTNMDGDTDEWVPGYNGNSLALTEAGNTDTDYVVLAADGELPLRPEDSYSLVLWFRASSGGMLFAKAGNNETQRECALYIEETTGISGAYIGGTDLKITDGPDVTDAQWHMVTLVNNVSAGTFSIYLDEGTYFAKGTPGSGRTISDVLLGTRRNDDANTGTASDYDGLLDDIRLYNAALSAGEIHGLYSGRAESAASVSYGPGTVPAFASVEITANSAPVFEFVAPDSTGGIADETFIIRWTDDDPDTDAQISLYYDINSSGEDGILITEGLSEDADGEGDTYVWDTSSVPEGEYYIYAIIDDGVNDPVPVYSAGSVAVYPPLPVIKSFSADPATIIAGGSSTLIWRVSGANSVVIEPGIGTVSLNGARDVVPSETTVYTLTASGPGGVITESVTVTVADTDLVPQDMDLSGTTTDNRTLAISGSVSVNISNAGTTGTNGTFSVIFFEDRDGNGAYDEGVDQILGTSVSVSVPAAGGIVNVAADVSGTMMFADNRIFALVDKDGTIGETDETNNITNSMALCEFTPQVGTFDIVEEWSWHGSSGWWYAGKIASAPMVANLNDDNNDGLINENDIPEIIFTSDAEKKIKVLGGDSGLELFSFPQPTIGRISAVQTPAIGDIDNDGKPEILAIAEGTYDGKYKLFAFENDGQLKWESLYTDNLHSWYYQVSIADIDQDGDVEVIVLNHVFNHEGQEEWTGEFQGGYGASSVANLDLQGNPEIVTGNTAYRWNGEVFWHNDQVSNKSFSAIANLLPDTPEPEIVIAGGGYISLLRHNGSIVWSIDIPPDGVYQDNGGTPTIADFDNDGEPEIGVAGGYKYVVIEADGTIKWTATTQDTSSNITGSSVFDFEGDGKAEVLYADENFFYIFDGETGHEIYKIENDSYTWMEYPVVADVDNDNNAEIIVVSSGSNANKGNGIRVFGSASNSWVNTRKIWNQHSYHITNVNDDGTIPRIEANSWEEHNSYRCNYAVNALACVDLSASRLRVDSTSYPESVEITARIGNGGALHVNAGINVSFYDGDPENGGICLGTAVTPERLEPGSGGDVTFTWTGPTLGLHTVFAKADADENGNGIHRETDEGNNTASATVMVGNKYPVSDAGDDPAYVQTGTTVTLDGSGSSDADGDTLAYQWSFSYRPDGSTAELSDVSSVTPTFVPDVAGTYIVQLVVNDGYSDSGVDQVRITALSPVAVPVLDGLYRDAAEAALTEAGFVTGNISETYSSEIAEGFVITQNPASGTVLMPGTSVDLIISAGIETVAIPVISGMSRTDAESALTGAGFVIGTVDGVYISSVPADQVISSSPTGSAPAGATINLNISLGPWTGEDTEPPKISFSADRERVSVGESVVFTVSATDNAGLASLSLSVNNENINISNNHGTYTFSAAGIFTAGFSVTDSAGLTSSESLIISVTDPSDTTAATVTLLVPDSTTITNLYSVQAQIVDDSPVSYKLRFREKNTKKWYTFNTGIVTDVSGATVTLGNFDPTILKNGVYELTLQVEDASGNTAGDMVAVILEGGLKLGQVNFSAEDLALPNAGLPVNMVRTYDSRSLGDGDFGPGWNLPSSETKISATSDSFSEDWDLDSGGSSFIRTYYLIEKRQHIAVIRFSDTEIYKFKMDVTPKSSRITPLTEYPMTVKWLAQDDTQGTLQALDYDSALRYSETDGQLLEYGIRPYDPKRFRLTLPSGVSYVLDMDKGLESMTDVYGRTVSYSDSGISSSSGVSIAFERGAGNRIEEITDAWGRKVKYYYDAEGSLEKVVQEDDKLPGAMNYLANCAYAEGVWEQPVLKEIKAPDGKVLGTFEYDSTGKVIGLKDADGRRVVYGYDLPNYTQDVTDKWGDTTTYAYDPRGNVTRKTDARGVVTEWVYDGDDNRTSEKISVDGQQRETKWTYDDRGNQRTETVVLEDGSELTTAYTYNDRDQVETILDAKGYETVNRYDDKGNLSFTLDAEGNLVSYEYDTSGNLEFMTDAEGHTTGYTYDTSGNMLSEEDPLGNITRYTYDSYGNKKTEKVKRTIDGVLTELTTSYEYDYKSRIIQTTYPDSTFTRTEYDETTGKKSAEIARHKADEPEHTTSYVYHGDGELNQVNYPDGTTEKYTFAEGSGDEEGYSKTAKDRAGITVTYVYDKAGNQIRTVFTDGSYTENEYNEAGELTATIDTRGNRTEYEHNAAGRKTLVRNVLSDSNPVKTLFEYDENGNLVKTTDALTHEITYVYDRANRRVKTVFTKDDGSQVETSVTYDNSGKKTAETDANGRTVRYDYDDAGRMTAVVQLLDGREIVTEYEYDEAGNKISQLNPNNTVPVTWTYDEAGRVKTHTLPEGMSESFSYYSDGTLKTHTDFNEDITRLYYYPDSGLLQSKQFDKDGSSVLFTYTNDGKPDIVTVTRADGTTDKQTDYDYDSVWGWLASVDGPNGMISYTYDEAGNRETVITPSDTNATTYTYDELNRLKTVTEPDGTSRTTYTYDAVGNRKTISYPNGTETEYFYDSQNRLTRTENRKSDDTVFSAYEYELDDSGNREFLTEYASGAVVRTVDYAYDDLYRLTGETDYAADGSVERSVTYGYDDFGNRVSKTDASGMIEYRYDRNDRLYLEIHPDGSTITYSYDDNGNTLTRTGSTGTTTYSWDAENRMTAVDNSGTVTNYGYDADGIRISAGTGGTTTRYLVDKNRDYAQVLEEKDDSGTLLVSYVYGDDLVRQERGGADFYYHYDGQLSTRQLTDASGNVTDTYTYDAFGDVLSQAGTTENSYMYTGEQYDPNAAAYYLRARYYDPAAGRFLSSDPYAGRMNDPVTLHKYLYANANPVLYNDPSGLFTTLQVMTVSSNILTTLITIAHSSYIVSQLLTNLPDNAFMGDTDCKVFSVSVEMSTGGAYIAASAFVAGNVGFDVLLPKSGSEFWVYPYIGASYGTKKDKLSGSVSIGSVWNVKEPGQYEGEFFVISPSALPAKIRSRVAPNVTIFAGAPDDTGNVSYGYSFGVTGGSGYSISLAHTYYFSPKRIMRGGGSGELTFDEVMNQKLSQDDLELIFGGY